MQKTRLTAAVFFSAFIAFASAHWRLSKPVITTTASTAIAIFAITTASAAITMVVITASFPVLAMSSSATSLREVFELLH
jgi:hypothetical protein